MVLWVWTSHFTGSDSYHREAGMTCFTAIPKQLLRRESSTPFRKYRNIHHFRCLITIWSIGLYRREVNNIISLWGRKHASIAALAPTSFLFHVVTILCFKKPPYSNNDHIGSHSQSLDFKTVINKVKNIPVYLQGSLLKSAICTSNALCSWVQKFNTMQGKFRRRENKNRRLTYAYTRTHRTICPHTGRSAPRCVL